MSKSTNEKPLVDVVSLYLPDDMADAFEQLKLVIMRHKAERWSFVTADRTVNALWLLMQLALQEENTDAT